MKYEITKLKPNYKWRIRSFLMGFGCAVVLVLGINAIGHSRASESPQMIHLEQGCGSEELNQHVIDKLSIVLDGNPLHASLMTITPERKPVR